MIKNFILKTITAAMVIIYVIYGSAYDSESWIPAIACAISLAWIALFCWANRFFRDYKRRIW